MQKNSYSYDELISCGKGDLFGEGNAKLPLPPMLMFDRITEIKKDIGQFKKGFIKAELDIKDNLWFFDCHFKNDPVMPGCLGLDAMWQLVGFYLGWKGEPGKGRALGVNSVKFTGEVLTTAKIAKYEEKLCLLRYFRLQRLVRLCHITGIGSTQGRTSGCQPNCAAGPTSNRNRVRQLHRRSIVHGHN